MKRAGASLFRVGQEAEEVRRHGETDRIADFDVRATLSRSVRPRILMSSPDHIVYVVDDDAGIREALGDLFASLARVVGSVDA